MARGADLNIKSAIQMLQQMERVSATVSLKALRQAVAMAAFSGERNAKFALTRLVYSQPERGYRRTGTLRRSVMAASPDYDHSGDEDAARRGELSRGISGGAALEVTRVSADRIESTFGSWISYAARINDGTTFMEPRPFLDEAEITAQQDLERFTIVALDQIAKAALR